MSVSKHNRTNRRGQVTRPHKVWKKQQNITKALQKWSSSPNRGNKHNSVNPPVDPNVISSNFKYWEGGQSESK